MPEKSGSDVFACPLNCIFRKNSKTRRDQSSEGNVPDLISVAVANSASGSFDQLPQHGVDSHDSQTLGINGTVPPECSAKSKRFNIFKFKFGKQPPKSCKSSLPSQPDARPTLADAANSTRVENAIDNFIQLQQSDFSSDSKTTPPAHEAPQSSENSVRVEEETSTNEPAEPNSSLTQGNIPQSNSREEPSKGPRPNLLGQSEADSIQSASSYLCVETKTVVISLDKKTDLGVTISGNIDRRNEDCGLSITAITKDSIAFQSGQIKRNDLIIKVNDIDLQKMSNGEAMRTLVREFSQRYIMTLVLVGCQNATDDGRGSIRFSSKLRSRLDREAKLPWEFQTRPDLAEIKALLRNWRAARRAEGGDSATFQVHSKWKFCSLDSSVKFCSSRHACRPSRVQNTVDDGHPRGPSIFSGLELVNLIYESFLEMDSRDDARRYARLLMNRGIVSRALDVFSKDELYNIGSSLLLNGSRLLDLILESARWTNSSTEAQRFAQLMLHWGFIRQAVDNFDEDELYVVRPIRPL